MTTSDQINELAAALSKAQAAMKGAAKDSENPHFRSKYADLASVREACWKPLTDHGLSVVQSPRLVNTGDGTWVVEVETRLLHTSGQFLADVAATPIAKADAQGVGSATTYLRRYALAAFAGIAPEDDDGNAASQPHTPAPSRSQFVNGDKPPASMPRTGAAGDPLKIVNVSQKQITGGRTQWTVTFSDGVVATTINERVAVKVSNAFEDGLAVRPTFEQKGRFTNLTGIEIAARDVPENIFADEPPPLDENDIPFAWLLPLVLPALGLMGLWS